MKHTHINPNQVRVFDVLLCGDPIDPYFQFGMTVQDSFILFVMTKTICSSTTRTPTKWELNNCLHSELTSHTEWNPSQALY